MIRQIPGWQHIYSGKVRDLYESAEHPDLILVVASDRVSAFDTILEPEIPDKGSNLTQLTLWWFDQLDVPNHTDSSVAVPEEVAGRAMVCRKLEMFPIECVVRGYLSGSGYKDYLATGEICGVRLPAGVKQGDKLPEPIFTPAYKAQLGDKDENISFEKVVELIGKENAEALKTLSLEIFRKASALAEKSGLILADTKFEFGLDLKTNQITLADEVLTPDSSRYWSKAAWESGNRTDSFDKQIVRNWLAANWDPTSGTKPPVLPDFIVTQTTEKYRELLRLLTGN
ncbi:MAG: phosphoribosylaminoimidazolesuccinocarboxamide synthase [Acidobacteria bacterium]|nr:phosphoribosylaminoimidazolesuccinocarboxamide synthase [Acidobacteriota bacterium]